VIRSGDDVSNSISGWTVPSCGRTRLQVRHPLAGAGKQAIIHTGTGTSYTTSASTHLYWGWSWYVSNNTGDKVL